MITPNLVAAARELLGRIEAENATSVCATGDPLGAVDMDVIEHELDALNAALASSPDPETAGESVVLEGDFETRTTINDDKPDESVTYLYVDGVEIGGKIAGVAGTGEFYDNDGSPERTFGMRYGPVRLIITPIKERGE